MKFTSKTIQWIFGGVGTTVLGIMLEQSFCSKTEVPQTSFENKIHENKGGQIASQIGTLNNYYNDPNDTMSTIAFQRLVDENKRLYNELNKKNISRRTNSSLKPVGEDNSNKQSEINAPSALIATKDQIGDNVVNYNSLELPAPQFKLISAEKKEGKFKDRGNPRSITEFNFKFSIEFEYYSKIAKNELAIAFQSKNKYNINASYKVGSSMFSQGINICDADGNTKVCGLQNPINGTYLAEILSNENIQNPIDQLMIRIDKDKFYMLTQ